MTPFRIVVHVDPLTTGRNRLGEKCFGRAIRLKAEAKEQALLAWHIAGRPRSDRPVRVSVTIRRGAAFDPFNVHDCLKPVIDGLFNATRNGGEGITPDDSARWIVPGDVRFDTGRKWLGDEHVEFHVEPASAVEATHQNAPQAAPAAPGSEKADPGMVRVGRRQRRTS